MLTTQTVDTSLLPPKRKRRRIKKSKGVRDLTILDLPNEILLMVFQQLSLPDRAILALTCKSLAFTLDTLKQLNWEKISIATRWRYAKDNIVHFTKARLGKKFFPPELKYCMRCGKYVPRDVDFWKNKMYKEFGNSMGELGCKFGAWTYIERWHVNYRGKECTLDWKLKSWAKGNRAEPCPRCTFVSTS